MSFLQNHTGIAVNSVINSDTELEFIYNDKYYTCTRLLLYGIANLNFKHGPSDLL